MSRSAIPKDVLARVQREAKQTIKQGQAELKRAQEEVERQEREQNPEFVAKARVVIELIPEAIRRAVLAGKRQAVLITPIRGLPWNAGWAVSTQQLRGWERIVADACEEMGLAVGVLPQHDGGGRDAWHELVLSW